MKTVSLYLFVLIGNTYKMLIQQRKKGKSKSTQSFIGVCQPGMNRKMTKKEILKKALKKALIRATSKELGKGFSKNFFKDCKLTALPTETFVAKEEESVAYNFMGEISEKQMELIEIHSEAKLILIGKEDIPRIKSTKDSTLKKGDLLFFPDQHPIILNLLDNIEKFVRPQKTKI